MIPEQNKETFVIESNNLQQLLDALKKEGYKVIGPKISDQAIIYDEIETVSELPIGIKDVQEPGKYKLEKRSDKAFFGFTVSPQSWKKYLLPPVTKLWEATYSKDGICFKEESLPDKKQAFIGVKACELNAIKVQDKVFLEGEFVNPLYKRLRENTFIVAINCIYASKNCFCTSMNTGPKHTEGYDLALTEVIEDEKHYFVVEVGSEQGMEILKSLDSKAASKSNLVKMEQV
ncbi:MAG: sulfite reductase subunit A, partial [Candidatus Melainabacteria bacterium]|nr:sulfite reductase subunit A [Candidatus Melainabacteria bacterium]